MRLFMVMVNMVCLEQRPNLVINPSEGLFMLKEKKNSMLLFHVRRSISSSELGGID